MVYTKLSTNLIKAFLKGYDRMMTVITAIH